MKGRKIFRAIILFATILGLTVGCGAQSGNQPKLGAANPAKAEQTNTSGPVQAGMLQLHFIDVGQGDAILVRTSSKSVLIDSGDISARDKVVAFLKSQGITELDAVLITHPHADHLGGMSAVLDHFAVKQVYDSGFQTSSELLKKYLQQLDRKKIPFKLARPGMIINLGEGATLEVLAPQEPFLNGTHSDVNNNSVVTRLVFGEFTALLMGDTETEGEERLLASHAKIGSKVLKVGHHGSKTSSSKAFLQAVKPETAVIMVGENNDYHHPHPSAMKRLDATKAQIFRTDLLGTITIETDGKKYNISNEK